MTDDERRRQAQERFRDLAARTGPLEQRGLMAVGGGESDDERIARLTALARRVWPDRDAKVSTSDDPEEWGACVILDEDGEWEQHLATDHPRALDALEAALLVMAEDATRRVGLLDVVAVYGRTPAWVCSRCGHRGDEGGERG